MESQLQIIFNSLRIKTCYLYWVLFREQKYVSIVKHILNSIITDIVVIIPSLEGTHTNQEMIKPLKNLMVLITLAKRSESFVGSVHSPVGYKLF